MAAKKTPKPKDPITDRSLSVPLAIASLLLVLSTIWTLYYEVWGERPWKGYQSTFEETYTQHLENLKKQTKLEVLELRGSQVTKKRIEALKKELPKVEISSGFDE